MKKIILILLPLFAVTSISPLGVFKKALKNGNPVLVRGINDTNQSNIRLVDTRDQLSIFLKLGTFSQEGGRCSIKPPYQGEFGIESCQYLVTLWRCGEFSDLKAMLLYAHQNDHLPVLYFKYGRGIHYIQLEDYIDEIVGLQTNLTEYLSQICLKYFQEKFVA